MKGKTVTGLDVPDRYERGSPERIVLLAARLSRYLSTKS
jgi:predicted protein tyrosine phosphatase